MTVTVFTAEEAGVTIRSGDNTYSKAVAGTGSAFEVYNYVTTNNYGAGQRFALVGPYYTIYLPCLSFDTSSLPDDDVIDSVVLSLKGVNDLTTTDFTLQVRAYDWGASVSTADWILPSNYGNYTLLATKSTVGIGAGSFVDMISEPAFADAINRSGRTMLTVTSNRVAAGTTPTGEERWHFVSEYVSGGEPKLTITHHSSASSPRILGTRVW